MLYNECVLSVGVCIVCVFERWCLDYMRALSVSALHVCVECVCVCVWVWVECCRLYYQQRVSFESCVTCVF